MVTYSQGPLWVVSGRYNRSATGQKRTYLVRVRNTYGTSSILDVLMPLISVYADFNAIEYQPGSSQADMPLTGYGTLCSLAQKRLSLVEGMRLLLYEPNDIECEVEVYFDFGRTDPSGRLGEWVARFDPSTIRPTLLTEFSCRCHPCIVCGTDFLKTPRKTRDYTERCEHCGTSVMAPLATPLL